MAWWTISMTPLRPEPVARKVSTGRPAAWVNLRTGVPERGAALPAFSARLRMSEWAQLRGCEREREGGEGGEVWRGGWGETRAHTQGHTRIPLLSTVMGTMGQISLSPSLSVKARPCKRATGLSQAMTPMSKQWTSPLAPQWFFHLLAKGCFQPSHWVLTL